MMTVDSQEETLVLSFQTRDQSGVEADSLVRNTSLSAACGGVHGFLAIGI